MLCKLNKRKTKIQNTSRTQRENRALCTHNNNTTASKKMKNKNKKIWKRKRVAHVYRYGLSSLAKYVGRVDPTLIYEFLGLCTLYRKGRKISIRILYNTQTGPLLLSHNNSIPLNISLFVHILWLCFRAQFTLY